MRPDRLRVILLGVLALAIAGLLLGGFSMRWLSWGGTDTRRIQVGLRDNQVCSDSYWSFPGDPTPTCEAPPVRLNSWTSSALGRIAFAAGLAAAAVLVVLAWPVCTRRPVRRWMFVATLLLLLLAGACAIAFVLLAPAPLAVGEGCYVFCAGAVLGLSGMISGAASSRRGP